MHGREAQLHRVEHEDLHDLYLLASETSPGWEMLVPWAKSMIKILSLQALASLDA